jgi:hypothetical protein
LSSHNKFCQDTQHIAFNIFLRNHDWKSTVESMPTYCHESESGDHCPEINSMTLTLPLMNSARVTANETKVALVHLQDAAEVLIEKGNLQKGRERCNRLRQEIKGATAQTVTPCY